MVETIIYNNVYVWSIFMFLTSVICIKSLVYKIFNCMDVTADDNGVIQQVFFIGGCNGNLQGISRLVTGQKINDVIRKLDGIRCGTKPTSCPDQLCRALEQLIIQ